MVPISAKKKTGVAKALPRRSTIAEDRLWTRLRRRQLHGAYFRRQHPIGPYVADFYCAEARLIIEVDGGGHAMTIARDSNRTAHLEKRGCQVLRVWNSDVLENVGGVVALIQHALLKRRSDAGNPPP